MVLLLAVVAPVQALAQDGAAAVLTLDQDRLFAESAFGKAAMDRERAASEALEAENAAIEARLTSQEQDLTQRRPTLAAEEFAALATAFDEEVERIRTAQDAKIRAIVQARDADRTAFLRAVVPVLGKLLEDKGAAAILDKSSVIIALTSLDVTDEAIARVDAVLGPGPAAPTPAPAPATPPGP